MRVLGALLVGPARHGAYAAGLALGAIAVGDAHDVSAAFRGLEEENDGNAVESLAAGLDLLRCATERVEGLHLPPNEYGVTHATLVRCTAPASRAADAAAASALGCVREGLSAAFSESAEALVASDAGGGPISSHVATVAAGAAAALAAVARGDGKGRHPRPAPASPSSRSTAARFRRS